MRVELGSGCLNMETEFMLQNVKSGKSLLKMCAIRNGQYFFIAVHETPGQRTGSLYSHNQSKMLHKGECNL